MKQVTPADLKRLEQKINLLNDKIDRIMEVQGIAFIQTVTMVQKEEKKKRKTREQQHQKLLEKEQFQQKVLQGMKDAALRMGVGRMLQQQFGLAVSPPAARIKEYLQTKDPKAFDGLKRIGQGKKK